MTRDSILKLGAPASLTYILTAGESAVVNGLLTRLPNSTSSTRKNTRPVSASTSSRST